ncbi:ATP-binding cassette domain-containing protein [Kouleothrix sp.]|uniref:ATP-binding cassette domain-containing protein n=1 Tax=Kouleothrix sp. TaxID=2779161 RepID=UPI0039190017
MTDAIITVSGLHYRYPTGAAPVLRGVDLALRRGEFVGLVGSPGAGKTTLCQALKRTHPHYTPGRAARRGAVTAATPPRSQSPSFRPASGWCFRMPTRSW